MDHTIRSLDMDKGKDPHKPAEGDPDSFLHVHAS